MTACFLSNIFAKYYKNPSMLSPVIAKNVGDVFIWDTVYVLMRWRARNLDEQTLSLAV